MFSSHSSPNIVRDVSAKRLAVVAAVVCFSTAISAQELRMPKRMVVPLDFQSQFDNGRYGRMIGDMVWSKLDKANRDEGVRFVLPESMLDVRDWMQRRNVHPDRDTSLTELRNVLREDWRADVVVWGSVERVPGSARDVYDISIRVADIASDPPKLIVSTDARTKTVSEIPHVYVKAALDRLLERSEGAAAVASGDDIERRWREGKNLVQGDFEKGRGAPAGWSPLPPYVSWTPVPTESGRSNRVIRFEFPEVVAANEGVLYYSDYFPVEEGALYRFACRWRSTGSSVKVFIKCYDELPTRFQQNNESGGGTERREVYRSQQNLKGPKGQWNEHVEDFTPKHAQFTPRWGRVMLYAYWPAGAVEFDDIVVKQIRPAPRESSNDLPSQ